jgi:hypothetical protein
MPPAPNDPLDNVIDGILRPINVLLRNNCYGASLVLIYSAIDTMAYSSLRPGDAQTRAVFINWVDRYLRFDGDQQLTGADVYGARCGVLHTFGVDSDMFRNGRCRQLLYRVGEGQSPVVYAPDHHPDSVVVNIHALRDAFINALVAYLDETVQDQARFDQVLGQLRKCLHEIPEA